MFNKYDIKKMEEQEDEKLVGFPWNYSIKVKLLILIIVINLYDSL